MEKIVFKKKLFCVNIYGDEYEIRKPKGIEKQEVLEKLINLEQERVSGKKLKGNEDVIIFKELIEMLGLKKDVFDEMYEEDQAELVNQLLNIKK